MAEPQNGTGRQFLQKEGILRFLLGVVIAIAGVLTAYHATIYGIKSDLATKADSEIVARIDSRLVHIEAILNERVATKAELQLVRDDLNGKLIKIEAKLNMLP